MPVGELFDEKILQKLLNKLKKFIKNQKFSKFLYLIVSVLFRSLIVVTTVGLAEAFGDRFGVVMSFIGALSPNPLAFG